MMLALQSFGGRVESDANWRTDHSTHQWKYSLSQLVVLESAATSSFLTTTNLTAHRSRAKCRPSNPSLYVRPEYTKPHISSVGSRTSPPCQLALPSTPRISHFSPWSLSLTAHPGHRRQGPLARSPRQHRRQAAPQRSEDRRRAM